MKSIIRFQLLAIVALALFNANCEAESAKSKKKPTTNTSSSCPTEASGELPDCVCETGEYDSESNTCEVAQVFCPDEATGDFPECECESGTYSSATNTCEAGDPGMLTVSAALTVGTYADKAYSVYLYDGAGNLAGAIYTSNTADSSGEISQTLYEVDETGCVTDSAGTATIPAGNYSAYFVIDTNDDVNTTKPSGCSNSGGILTTGEKGIKETVEIDGDKTWTISEGSLVDTASQTIEVDSSGSGTVGICYVFHQARSFTDFPTTPAEISGLNSTLINFGGLTAGAGTISPTAYLVPDTYKLACYVSVGAAVASGDKTIISTAMFANATTTFDSGWSTH